jgi:outer membrane protease
MEAHAVVTPSCLDKAYKKLQAGCAWVAIMFDDEGVWVYNSGAKIEDVADDIADMSYEERMNYLIAGVLEMEEHAEDVTP